MKQILLLIGVTWGLASPLRGQKSTVSYELVPNDDSIYVERFASSNTDENRFTANNFIYVANRQWTYDYYYENQTGQKFWFEPVTTSVGASAWRWVSVDSASSSTVRRVRLTVTVGLGPFATMPGYDQTILQYNYLSATGVAPFNEQTGVIENEKNVWMHPPRSQFFRVLELNPFPYIQAPFQIGNKWRWRLTIGDPWQDARWKTWSGRILTNYQYEITGIQAIKTPAGSFSCYKIQATANSRLGQTHLTAYFSSQAGFVRLEYVNIDGSKTVLVLNSLDPLVVSGKP
jgi:hypothetical protein